MKLLSSITSSLSDQSALLSNRFSDTLIYLRSEVLAEVGVKLVVSWDVVQRILLFRHQRFGENFCLHLQGRRLYPEHGGNSLLIDFISIADII
jgi:hypothetical protein